MSRDPRVNPKPGDVIEFRGERCVVKSCGFRAKYKNARLVVEFEDGEWCFLSDLHENAEVIHAAD